MTTTQNTAEAEKAIRQIRSRIEKSLGANAQYTRLTPDNKTPVGSFKEGRRNRLKHIPKNGNYGIIPQKRLFILDFDDHRKDAWNIEKQLDFFSDFFDMNLRESFAVITQGGGVHVYLYLPESFEPRGERALPKSSLRTYNEAFAQYLGKEVLLDADLRSPYANGYVVGPTSSISVGRRKYPSYILANESFGFSSSADILTLSVEACEKLCDVREIKHSVDKPKQLTDPVDALLSVKDILEYTIPKGATFADADKIKDRSKPSQKTINQLKAKIKQKKIKNFHQARAFTKAALHCCYDDYSIALVCMELGIDKDSYRKDSVGFKALVGDLKRFKPHSCYHGSLCSKGQMASASRAAKSPVSIAERNKQKLEQGFFSNNSFRKMDPRVVDLGKISEAIRGNSRKKAVSQQYTDVMSILNYYIQPLANVGSTRFLLAYDDMMKRLDMDLSRVRQAMRVLRDKGILQVEQKQTTGLAATYSLSSKFVHKFLSKTLHISWANHNADRVVKQSIYFDFSDGLFKTVFGNNEVASNVDYSSWVLPMWEAVVGKHDSHRAGAATRYLRSEKEALAEIDEMNRAYDEMTSEEKRQNDSDNSSISEDFLVDPMTGEILEYSSSGVSPPAI